jgi:hypothetical protein
MRLLRLIYFHIYNTYYKDGKYRNDIPHLTAFGIVGCCLSIILLAVLFTIHQFFFHERISIQLVVLPFIILLGMFYYMFLYESKYIGIYEEFKNSKWDTWSIKFLSWSILFVAFLLIGLYAYIFNRT